MSESIEIRPRPRRVPAPATRQAQVDPGRERGTQPGRVFARPRPTHAGGRLSVRQNPDEARQPRPRLQPGARKVECAPVAATGSGRRAY
jgi:hypothetical protein